MSFQIQPRVHFLCRKCGIFRHARRLESSLQCARSTQNYKDRRSFFVIVKNEEFSSSYLENLDKVLLEINEEYYRDTFYLTGKTSLEIILYDDTNFVEKVYRKFNELNIAEDIKVNANFVVGEKNINLIFRSKNYKDFEKFI